MKKYGGLQIHQSLLHYQHNAIFKQLFSMNNLAQTKQKFLLPVFWIHVLAWIFFIAYETGILYIQKFFSYKAFLIGLPFYGLNIMFFYVNYHVLNYAFKKGGNVYLNAFLLTVLQIAILMPIKFGVEYLTLPPERFQILLSKANATQYLILGVWRCLYYWAFSLIYWSTMRTIKYRQVISAADKQTIILLQEKSTLEKNLSDTRFAYYQQQINPHFLFNTLNFIYNSVYKHSKPAGNAVILLSEIMRYSLDDMDVDGKAVIENEVEQIQNLIEINRLRFDYKLYITFCTEGDLENLRFIPLILLTFAENVFKYGQLKDEKNPARLSLILTEDNRLIFETWNAKKHVNQLKGGTGIGVSNAIKRLEYTYADGFNLDINDQEKSYALKLIVNL